MALEINLGSLCDPIGEQLKKQGFEIPDLDAKRFQTIANAIIVLKLHGILKDSTVVSAEKKLIKQIGAVVSKAIADKEKTESAAGVS